ncbi:hypothetical protein PN36_00820 [Candidatus Thiomargarita nelsonii]|uniref:CheW-like domain-containing protein n=1 Tax=Candidatus Thiomargarita nelsonii TaxID=1003181 RepID=A0A0A6P956_9GAMM|nr:hypothetical protein PN36_00820 [Candidatus Thiomargarita nelsonii]
MYILLVFDGIYLFVPQEEVHSVEIISDVTHSSQAGVVWFLEHGLESPVFCLDSDFSLLLEVPEKREYFVLLKADPQPVGITCDEVENVNFKQEHLHPQDLPVVMKTPDSPIKQLVSYQDKMAYVCSGAALIKHLSVHS